MPAKKTAAAPPKDDDTGAHISATQMRQMHALLRDHGITGDKAVHEYLTIDLGRSVESRTDLTTVEAARIIQELETAPVAHGPVPGFTAAQVAQLLLPINTNRVVDDGQGHASLSQQDVTAHLIRILGFGGYDITVLSAAPVFETPRDETAKRWDVCYRALVRLTVRDPAGRVVASYDNGSTGMAENQKRGAAHDLAYKSAISLSTKRCAINLGDQFGLSLYNKGQLAALVMGTLVDPNRPPRPSDDVQEGVAAQVSMGNTEGDEPEPAPDEAPQTAQQPPGLPPYYGPTTAELLTLVDDHAKRAGVTYEQITAKWRAANGDLSVNDLDGLPPQQIAPLEASIAAYLLEHPPAGSAVP